MKYPKLFAVAILVGVSTIALWAQATRIQTSGTLPASCTVGSIYNKTGTDAGFYTCLTTNVWTGPLASPAYVGEQIAAVNTGGGASQNSFLVNGGQVIWTSAYNFTVSAGTAYLEGVQFTWAQQNVTLTAADPTDPRIDAIVVSSAGTVSAVAGTAAAQPSAPVLDPGTQLFLTNVTVAAGSSEPAEVVTTLLYCDNVGSPTEWNFTTSGTGFNTNSTNNPISGCTKSIEGTTVAANAYAQGQIGSGTFDPNGANFLIFNIRSKATWNANRGLTITLRNAGVQVGQPITFNRTAFGFDSSQTSTYQQIAIPILQFGIPNGSVITQVRFQDYGGSIGFYIGQVGFQGGVTVPANPGITQEQADARYAFRGLTTASGLTVTTDTLVGRDTAGTGALENIAIGSGLSLSGGTLSVTGGGAALSAITAATGTNTIDNGEFTQTWRFTFNGGAEHGLVLTESAASTGGANNQLVLAVDTLASSTAIPLRVTNLGAGNSFEVWDEATDTTPGMLIDAAGKVAFGGTNTSNQFAIHYNAAAGGDYFAIGGASSTVFKIHKAGGGADAFRVGTTTNDNWALQTNGFPQFWIMADGRMLVGNFNGAGTSFSGLSNDGELEFCGVGDGNDECLAWNYDDPASGANSVGVTSSTGVNNLVFTSMNIDAATFSAAGDSGHTGTACTAFTGGLCTTGTAPGELTPDQKEIAALKLAIMELRAELAALLRR